MSLLDETSPIFDESKSQVAKKEKYGFAALMVLILCLTSFMAGQASSHAAMASAVGSTSGVQWSQQESCSRWISSDIYQRCGADTWKCFRYAGFNGDFSGCVVPENPLSGSCEWAIDITKQTCTSK